MDCFLRICYTCVSLWKCQTMRTIRNQRNVLVVGRKNWRKTCFIQKLAVNNFVGKLAPAELVSKIILNKKRESEDNISNNIYGGNIKTYRLIVTYNVSGLANKSNGLASFLTVTRKIWYYCVYIFYIIYPEKAIWKLNMVIQLNKRNFWLFISQFTLIK